MTSQHVVAVPHISNKAVTQLNAMQRGRPFSELRELLRGMVVRRMADDSPYYIAERDGVRYVFVVCRGYAVDAGRFALVTCQPSFKACKS